MREPEDEAIVSDCYFVNILKLQSRVLFREYTKAAKRCSVIVRELEMEVWFR